MRAERLTPDDWQVWRDLRLEGIRDTPIGFLETYDQALALTDDAWRARLAAPPRPGVHVCVYDGDAPVGIAGCFRDEAGVPVLFGVYVTPGARGNGALPALVAAAAGWAAPDGLTLEVHEDNPRAHRAYVKLGFVETGRRRPSPLDGRDLVQMRLP